jgi:hypothetical protein
VGRSRPRRRILSPALQAARARRKWQGPPFSADAIGARGLHRWRLQVLAWVATGVRVPRILRRDRLEQGRKARRDIGAFSFLGMCSRMTFRRDRPRFTRRPHAIAGYQRRHARWLRI